MVSKEAGKACFQAVISRTLMVEQGKSPKLTSP